MATNLFKLNYTEHEQTIEELCASLETDPGKGLTWSEAKKRHAKNGPNILQPPKKTYEIVRFIKTLFHGFSFLLWCGALLSLFIFFFDGWNQEAMKYDYLGLAIALIVVVLIAGIFSFYQEGKSGKVMQSFMNLLPDEAQVIRNGKTMRLLAKKLVVGDLLVLESGDKIAADVRIIESRSLKTDHSSLTGESDHLLRSVTASDHDPIKTSNLGFFGTYVVEGYGKGIVIRTGEDTFMGSIARLTSEIKEPPTTLAREISRFIVYLMSWASCIGIAISAVMLIIGYKWNQVLIFFIGMIIANVPEGLMPTLTLSLTLASQRMAARNCLVKKLDVVESLGTTSIICSDKTGTLTQNRMTVSHLMFNRRLNGVGLIGESKTKRIWGKKCLEALSRCASLCSRAEFKKTKRRHFSVIRRDVVGDASESAILKCPEIATEKEMQQLRRQYPKLFELPFNSTEKFSLSVHEVDEMGFLLVMKGAPEKILAVCTTVLLEEQEVPMTEGFHAKITNACSMLATSGERVLAFCDLEDFDFDEENFKPPTTGMRFLGLVSMIDPPRPNVPEAVEKCRDAGIKLIMITGDHHRTALAIAKQVHIISAYSVVDEELPKTEDNTLKITNDAIVLKGEQLDEISNQLLDQVIQGYEEIVFARTNPKQKLRIVESCQRTGAVVAVTGDGVNDAPALKKADIGISMGGGSAVAKQASKIVLLDDNFATLVNGIEEGRLVFENLKKSIGYTLTHIPPEVLLLLAHLLAGIPLPMSVITILCIDVGTDLWPSIALAYEKPEIDLMRQKPRNVYSDRLVNVPLVFQAFTMGIAETLAGLLAYFIVMAESGWLPYDLLETISFWSTESVMTDSYGTTWPLKERKLLEQTCYSAALVAVVETQLINALVFKTSISSNITFGNFNLNLFLSLIFSFILTCIFIYIPGISDVFQMQRLSAQWWLPAVPIATAMFIYDEIRKKIVRDEPEGWLSKHTVP